MKNEQERNAEILNELENVDLENALSMIEIATEQELGEGVSAFIPATDTLDSEQTLSGKITDESVEKVKREVDDLIAEEKSKLEKICLIGHNYLYFGEGEIDVTDEVRIQVGQLFGKLQNGLLSTKEFNRLVSLTAQMNFNEMLRNTVDLVATVHINNIDTLSAVENKKIIPIFKPLYLKFVEKYRIFKINHKKDFSEQVDSLDKEKEELAKKMSFTVEEANDFMLGIIKSNDFDEKIKQEFSLNDFDALVEGTLESHDKFRNIEERCAVTLAKNGSYDLDELLEKESAWNSFSSNMFECIQKYQIKHLKDNYEVAHKYYAETNENGDLVCKVGDNLCIISRENMIDDIAKLSEMVKEYEIEMEENKSPEIKSEELIENDLSDTSFEKVDDENAVVPEIIEEENIENVNDDIKDTYIDLMSSIYGEEEAGRLASNEENIKAFEESSYSPNKYLEAIEEGKISEDVSYGEFVYNELEKSLEKSNETEEIEYAEDEEIDYELEQKLANAKHAKANNFDNAKKQKDIKLEDTSGIDVSVYEEDPMSFSNEEPVLTSKRR